MPSETAIDVHGLTRRYGSFTAVHDISFTVPRGEIVGFLGPNGAGKSTTLRILAGTLQATSGTATVAGWPVATHAAEVRRRLGYMAENNPLPDDLRVREYLRFRGRLRGIPGRDLRTRIDEVLELCDLKRVHTRIIGNLSKGFRQRVGIAEAILGRPEVAILDEPTIGLDPHQIVLIRDLLSRLRGRLSLLISSHILPEIEMTCDRVIIINGGHIVGTGTPAALRGEFFPGTRHLALASAPADRVRVALAPASADIRVTDAGDPLPDGWHRLRIEQPDGDTVPADALLSRLHAAGIGVRSFSAEQPTLEQVFMAATRRSWDVRMPAGRRQAA